MKTGQMDQVLGMVRSCLVECAAQQDWSEHRSSELAELVRECFRHAASNTPGHPGVVDPGLGRDVLRRAIRFVNENLESKLTWQEIAAHVGMDRFSFGRGFKHVTGITPHQYIIRCRMRKARNLLARGDTSLADIALEVGCCCQSHLTTLFRRHVGTTPGEFRRRMSQRVTTYQSRIDRGGNLALA